MKEPDSYTPPEDDIERDEDQERIIMALAQLRVVIEQADWFHRLGQPLNDDTRIIAEDYVAQLGFPGVWVSGVTDWETAASTAENPEINSESWEAEETLRVHLTQEALLFLGEEDLGQALDAITTSASPIIFEAAANVANMWGVDDDEIIEACAGAALQACYNAALVIAAGEEEDHPCALKFALYETGHWPIAITGQTLNLF